MTVAMMMCCPSRKTFQILLPIVIGYGRRFRIALTVDSKRAVWFFFGFFCWIFCIKSSQQLWTLDITNLTRPMFLCWNEISCLCIHCMLTYFCWAKKGRGMILFCFPLIVVLTFVMFLSDHSVSFYHTTMIFSTLLAPTQKISDAARESPYKNRHLHFKVPMPPLTTVR